jgi:DeoR/GlpR family transcriptional regulator of sugar metabolism
MLKNQRHNEIIEILKKSSFATVAFLSKALYASLATIRRDLTLLEKDGYVKRCHGGAMILDGKNNSPIYFRREQNANEKLIMCSSAANLINRGDTVFLDASTTVYHISDFLTDIQDVTVVTNGLPISMKLAENGIKVYSTGGRLLRDSLAFVGISAEQAISSYNADIMFFSIASVSESGILSDWSEDEAKLRIEMSKNARKTVLMCDSSKIGTSSTFKLFDLGNIDYVITDKKLPSKIEKDFSLEILSSSPSFIYSVEKNRNHKV